MKISSFEEFISNYASEIVIWDFIFNMLLSAFFSFLLSVVYARFGTSISNRKNFASNFVIISMTTTLIIMIVKSSLALSLGLVGALSIVRFRTAIKEPEELGFLFVNIAIGLGLGADQRIITTIGFVLIITALILRSFIRYSNNTDEAFLILKTNNHHIEETEIINILSEKCNMLKIKRIEQNKNFLELSFNLQFKNIEALKTIKKELIELDDKMEITFLDTKNIST